MGDDDFAKFFENAGGPTDEQAAFGFMAGSLRAMFDALLGEGFDEDQALALVATYLNAEVVASHDRG